MRPEYFDFINDLNTVWAVILGALFASVSGFSAARIERILERRQRERDAALFFGEILVTLGLVLDMAADTKKIGEPFGPVTIRLLRLVHREINVYDRNRERLFDLQNTELRARVHSTVLRLLMPLEGLFDYHNEVTLLEGRRKNSGADVAELDARLAVLRERREDNFTFVLDSATLLKTAVRQIEPLAHQSFQAVENGVRAH